MLKFLVCVLLFLTSFSLITPAYAVNSQVNVSDGQINEALTNMPHVRFLPQNPLYYLIRFKELFNRFFTSSAVERAEFDFMISSKRLKEIYNLHQQNRVGEMEFLAGSYKVSTEKSISQLHKARSQNQEIVPTVDKIANGLRNQEVLLIKMYKDGDIDDDVVVFFEKYVGDLDQFKPGVKGRFKLIADEGAQEEGDNKPSPMPSPKITSEPTSSARPRRIIY